MTEKICTQYFNTHDNTLDNTWKDVDGDEQYLIFEHKPFLYSLKGTIAKKVSFEKTVYVTLIPETHEYNHLKELLWYSQEELDQFIQNEIEKRRKEIILQRTELQQMREEEIYSIMSDC